MQDGELEAVRRISELLFNVTNVDEILVATLHCALDEVGAEAGSILLADPDAKRLVFKHSIGKQPVPPGTAFPWDLGIAGRVFHSAHTEIIQDVPHDLHHYEAIDQLTGLTTRNMITLPLKRWKGEPIGVLNVLNKQGEGLDHRDETLLTIVSALAALFVEQIRLYDEAKLAEVVRLLGGVGHDLKNLLQPVVSGTELLKGELTDVCGALLQTNPDQARRSQEFSKEVVEMMQQATKRIHERVKEIADCVKGLSAPPQFSPCAVAEVAQEVCKTLGLMATEKQVALKMVGLSELPEIHADASRLYNAFYNLVNNAIPEVPAGGSVTISGQVAQGGTAVLIKVADTGRGMPPEVRERLFTARVVSTKKGGTGLGTKIVKDVVDAHRGTISVESRLGQGTTFEIRLPLDPTATETTGG